MIHITRKRYLERVTALRQTNRIIAITGLRGSGKTTFLASIAHELRGEKPPVRIVQLDGESGVLTGRQLLAEARALGAGPSALCLDNADAIENLSEALDEIGRNYATTIFIAGRRASLARELDRKLAAKPGRIDIMPLSYREFLEYRGLDDSRLALSLYAKTGGLPETGILAPDSPYASQFIRMMADSFLLTGIIEPNQIRNPGHIRKLLELVARSGGETLPARAICASFAAERLTISPQAALDYLGLCRDSGLIVPVKVLDIDRKKTVDSGDVWYFADSGLRAAFVKKAGPAEADRAYVNLVYLHLLDTGWTVAQGRVDTGRQIKETVSFTCEKDGKRIYVQTTGNSATAGERLRKRKALLAIRDAWPKYLVDPDGETGEDDGIRQVYLRDLLAGRTGYAELA
jgi:predicted AAA+ superfamily ATPase